MSDVTITVRGEHEVRLAPEQGVARATVRAEGPERAPVVERIASLAVEMRDELSALHEAGTIVEWTSQRTAIWSDRPWTGDGRRLAHVHYATVDFTATFADVTALSTWLSEIADRDGVQIGGVEWRLTPETRAAREREVAAHAVQVAVARAEAYARAIGRSAVTPVEIADLGLLGRAEASPSPAPPMLMRAAAYGTMDAAGTGPAVQYRPEDIMLSAAVEARFTAR